MISSLAKKLVLECFYRVCQKMTNQLLKQLIYLGGVKEMSLSSHVEIISNQLTGIIHKPAFWARNLASTVE